jgi:hypothetical protein
MEKFIEVVETMGALTVLGGLISAAGVASAFRFAEICTMQP